MQEPVIEKIPNGLKTAAYCRLSNEDREMDSIQTQILLVQDYIKNQPDLELADTYVDNGVSGTRFDRPEWNRLMEDVKRGDIQCIVVKDLSRFGRDYLETGYYIENIFPKLQVRFIAITDDFDSTRPGDMDSITVPVKNMVNAMYAKDISRKIHAALKGKRERGELTPSRAPMGYRYNGSGEKRYVTVEEPAGIIRMIFYWAGMGLTNGEICRRLNFLKIPTAGYWQYHSKGYCESPEKSEDYENDDETLEADETKQYDENMAHRRDVNSDDVDEKYRRWMAARLAKILMNQAYCGDIIMGKTSVKMFQVTQKDECDWFVKENAHEALVDRDTFQKINQRLKDNTQKRREHRDRSAQYREENKSSLQGMVYCGVCKRVCGTERKGGRDENENVKLGLVCFRCAGHYEYAPTGERRVPVYMQENKLRMVIMDQLSRMIDQMARKAELGNLKSADAPILRKQRELQTLALRKLEIQRNSDKLYETYVERTIDAEEYRFMKENYREQTEEADMEIAKKQKELQRLEKKKQDLLEFVRLIGKRDNVLAFDAELVKALVERIEIYENERVVLCFRFGDEMKKLLEEDETK